MNPRYRQLGYGIDSNDWYAVWLDTDSISTGNLLTVVFHLITAEKPIPYNGTIYRTIGDVVSALNSQSIPVF